MQRAVERSDERALAAAGGPERDNLAVVGQRLVVQFRVHPCPHYLVIEQLLAQLLHLLFHDLVQRGVDLAQLPARAFGIPDLAANERADRSLAALAAVCLESRGRGWGQMGHAVRPVFHI